MGYRFFPSDGQKQGSDGSAIDRLAGEKRQIGTPLATFAKLTQAIAADLTNQEVIRGV